MRNPPPPQVCNNGPKEGNFEEAEEDDLSRRATIRDVAEAAGVSKATVSRVLAGNYPVSRETADRVRAAVDLLSYSAKASARSLATGRADAFAVVVSEPLATFFADPTFARILQGITDTLGSTEIAPILLPTATPEEQAKALRLITSRTVDAVIHLSPWTDQGLLVSLLHEQIPVIICGQDARFESAGRFSFVYSDDRVGGRTAAEHLKSTGRRKPLAVLGTPSQQAAQDRYIGYTEVFPDLDHARTRWGGWGVADGRAAMTDLLSRHLEFDAVLAGSDRIARGVIEVLHEAGLDVPREIAVIGYDDDPSAINAAPTITTIAQPMHEQGAVACAIALEMIEGGPSRTEILPTLLRERQSA
ncbi:MAG: LacI family DNA-binding transcriptional regulator [Schaalia hyovaginalis]|uniref:LacI family DNA-binding transcriptional regulator n=1 Tax=Schaalia hyovaginalis TaxID=29316 RepID=UPI0026EFE58E|nr:LacI family DNA-binding transcriptional regulator [Schaalia hyovaginalis]MCI6556260.1 LacI family transcriptional regulator [Schaalia hyovaginalis]MDY5601120.1 LacI family DNA-binding transcriptional regulator [Schaalia hyovaginalis]